ncbi:protein kinase family protein [Halobacterium jilantaiense]|uniref:Serine/threonine protein kinase n=1 Tax=Halobacterium jilantaiense TaxID=355548 RepID=A0A1I0MZN7_9EURY|nr:protein kinase [Halobacterium jilantaiense]SEV94290.1 Serine/threonine protein kinase [Halobacterium jilantaiense]
MDTQRRDVDREAVAELQSSVDTNDVDELAARLSSDDSDERAGAAWRLVEAASSRPESVRAHLDSVVDSVDDDDIWVRRGATWVVAELAERQPDALSVNFSELVDMTTADDPLVRQNGAVAVASVTKRYPARATTGLSRLAALTDDEDALLARYATQAVRDVTEAIAARADDAGYPMLVRSTEAYAELFPDGVEVVTVGGDEAPDHPVYVSFGQDAPVRADEAGDTAVERPPDDLPAAPSVTVTRADLDPDLQLGSTPLTTDFRASVTDDTLEHGLVTFRRLDATDAAVQEAFRDALGQWAAIDDHDYVESVLGAGEDWAATRYDDGDTLARRGAPATVAEAVWLVDCVTRAVSYAHARGVVHGGLYPGVIRFLETPLGRWDAPLVADWGFAHATSGFRTPPIPAGFAAPEHRDPETYGRFDQSTDIYGLGALAYYLLTGEQPVAGGSVIDASVRNPALPESVDALFDRSLATDKQARFDTVLDFQTAFDELAADLGGGVAT